MKKVIKFLVGLVVKVIAVPIMLWDMAQAESVYLKSQYNAFINRK